MYKIAGTILSTLFLINPILSQAKIQLPALFSSKMVLQRDKPLQIWGYGDRGEAVKVFFAGKQISAKTSENGIWKAIFPALPAGGPFKMTIEGDSDKIVLDDILMGDVWLCAGQSNMEWPVKNSLNGSAEAEQANYNNIRLFQVSRNASSLPLTDFKNASWQSCTPQTIADFSAVGYFFSRELQKHQNVPLGLISANWGGSKIEPWMDAATLEKFPSYKGIIDTIKQRPDYLKWAEEQFNNTKRKAFYESLYSLDPVLRVTTLNADSLFKALSFKKMPVPGYWEEHRLADFDGGAWFVKSFNLPDGLVGKDFTLSLGFIDDYDFTFINGVKVGENYWNGRFRKYTVPAKLLNAGENKLLIYVIDRGDQGGFGSPADSLYLEEKGTPSPWRYFLKGSWDVASTFNLKGKSIQGSHRWPGIQQQPTMLYNGMIAPLTSYPIKGVLWYQGESNDGAPDTYKALFPALIRSWRDLWHQEDLPFLYVQLAGYGLARPGAWPYLREAQAHALSLPNTAMAVTIDIGDASDIHPRNKRDVGKRLALAARKIAYKEDVVYSGPVFDSMQIIENKVQLNFLHTGSGLVAHDPYGYVKGFEIAGEDLVFYPARAEIKGNSILLSNNSVKIPRAARYAWSNYPQDANLYNAEGLPASPFLFRNK